MSRQQRVLAYLQVIGLRKRIIMLRNLRNWALLFLGRSSTPEFGFKNISDAQIHGPVNLPDDVSRNAGGSSGGCGCYCELWHFSFGPS